MSKADFQIELHVEKAKELFEEPDFSVTSKGVGQSAGIDQMKEKVLTSGRKTADSCTFTIRVDDLEGTTPATLKETLRRYCANRIEENQRSILLTKRDGRRYLVLALSSVAIVALCIYLLSVFFPNLSHYEGVKFIVEVIVLAAWVILWEPIEALIYAWRPFQDENDFYRLFLNSAVVIT